MPDRLLPKYVRRRRVKGGMAYFWEPPTWARRLPEGEAPCPVVAEALGQDLLVAIQRAGVINAAFDEWRRSRRKAGDGDPAPTTATPGTMDWLVGKFQADPAYRDTAEKTRRGYDQGLALICGYVLPKSRQPFGRVRTDLIRPRHADALHEGLRWVEEAGPDGTVTRRERLATANAAMRAARRMWSVAIRRGWVDEASPNPFGRMNLKVTGGNTVAPTRAEVESFIAAARRLGRESVAVAAMLAFELCQREGDVIGTLTWNRYEPQRGRISVRQHKTGEWIWVPLLDEEGDLFPELRVALDGLPRRGPLIVMPDRPDKRESARAGRPVFKPYREDWFRKVVREVRDAAGLRSDFTFMSLRHGGLTELGDAGATDQEMQSLSAHRTRQTLTVYSRRSGEQAKRAARKRMALRMKQVRLSE